MAYRRGYFTIRGARKGRNEIDLLAFYPKSEEALHVEVNVSIDPIGWIGKKSLSDEDLPGGKVRDEAQIDEGIKTFVQGKYLNPNAVDLRERLLPNPHNCKFMYVYGKLNHPDKELPRLKAEGVETCYILEILEELKSGTGLPFETDSDAAHFVKMLKLDPLADQDHCG